MGLRFTAGVTGSDASLRQKVPTGGQEMAENLGKGERSGVSRPIMTLSGGLRRSARPEGLWLLAFGLRPLLAEAVQERTGHLHEVLARDLAIGLDADGREHGSEAIRNL